MCEYLKIKRDPLLRRNRLSEGGNGLVHMRALAGPERLTVRDS